MRILGCLLMLGLVGCASVDETPGSMAPRRGEEIVVAGRHVHTGAPVVLWTDPGGYDAYRFEKRFSRLDESHDAPSPRYGLRSDGLTDEEIERVRGGGWDLATLQRVVDQFVIHYDVCGTSRTCFRVLHDERFLSVHFLLDIDGTIYQTLDVKERAWHATSSNSRSVGIEIANIGAYARGNTERLDDWYGEDGEGAYITIPAHLGDGGVRTSGFQGRPARPEPIVGTIQGRELLMYDLTNEQYESLTKLTAALCTVLPRIECKYPRDEAGELIRERLDESRLAGYSGLLGHYHVQANKIDPGPAFDWERVVAGARALMGE